MPARARAPRLALALLLLLTALPAIAPPVPAAAATCAVTTTADAGVGSLRAALADAGCDAITFQAGLTGTITLASALPTIARIVSVTGPGASLLTVSYSTIGMGTVFAVGAAGALTLRDLTVNFGYEMTGISIDGGGTAAVTDSTFGSTFNGSGTGLAITGSGSGAMVTRSTFGGSNRLFAGLSIGNGGTATVTNSTFGNSFIGLAIGGTGSAATVTGSTFSASSDASGFGIRISDGGTATVTSTAFKGNGFGNGLNIIGAGSSATVNDSTFGDLATGLSITGAGSSAAVTGSTFSGNYNGMSLYSGSSATVTNTTISGGATGVIIGAGSGAAVTGSTFSGSTTAALTLQTGGTATLTGSTLSSNSVGLTINEGSTAALTNSTLSGNGTGLSFYHGGTATVTGSTLSGNNAGLYFDFGGDAAVTASTLSGNNQGLSFYLSGNATLTNSTLDGNGTGLYFNLGGTATLTNNTLSGNNAGLNFNLGGGATLLNTLLAKGDTPNCTYVNVSGAVTYNGRNLADDASCFANGPNSTVVAAGTTGLDPAGLLDNGGPTRTIALTATSPALDAGDDAICAIVPVNGVDQRGVSRTSGAGAHCDIGAYERAGAPPSPSSLPSPFPGSPPPSPNPATCVVTSLADSGAGTLRAALADPACGAITFALPGSAPWTITLASDLPTIARTVSVTGPGASSLTIDRNNTGRPAFILGASGDLTLAGMTVTGAQAGVVLVPASTVTVSDSTFGGFNSSLYFGGGGTATVTNSTIYSLFFDHGGVATVTGSTINLLSFIQGGTAMVTNSTVSNLNFDHGGGVTVTGSTINRLSVSGGGSATVDSSTFNNACSECGGLFLFQGGTVTVTNSTFNLSSGAVGLNLGGGGTATVANSTFRLSSGAIGLSLSQGGAATVTNSTLSGNGQGLSFYQGGTVTVTNTLLANGSGHNCTVSGPDIGSAFLNGGHNLADDATCFVNGANGSIVVAAGQAGLDPAGLQDHGGPTRTIALLPGSPALNAGDVAACAASPVSNQDQRGVARPQGAGCDIGAFEARTFTLTTGTTGAGTGTVSPATGPQLEGIVSVNATPTGSSTFAGWTLDGTPAGSANPLAVTLDANHTVVATFAALVPCVVTSLGDSGPGTLRAALGNTDGFANCGPITFNLPGSAPWTITLASDLPTIARTVSVTGPGAASLTIARNNESGRVFLLGAGGNLALTGLTVSGAQSAVALVANSAATVTASTLCGLSFSGGGTATITNSTLADPDRSYGFTGLAFANGGTATVTNSTISGNNTVFGASYGLYFGGGGAATITNSTIAASGDRGFTGLAFYGGGTAIVTNSTLSGRHADFGANTGLFFNGGGTATLVNSTLSDYEFGLDLVGGGSATLTNSTLSGNTYSLIFDSGGTATLTNTLLARGDQRNCTFVRQEAASALLNGGHNLADDTSCFANGANGSIAVAIGQTGLDAAGLQDNGGPTRTIALLPGSRALDAAAAAACAAGGPGAVNGADQRGVARPQGAGCDIGAYEVRAFTLTTGTAGSGTGTVSPATGPQIEGAVVGVSATPTGGSTFAGWTVDGTAAGTTNPLAVTMAAAHTVVATFTAPSGGNCAVTSLADSGAGTLRAALGDATCAAITFQAGLTGAISLASDLPAIARAVSVTGPGAGLLTVDRGSTNHPNTAFPLGAGGALTLSGLTVTGAEAAVAVVAASTATVSNSTLSGSTYGVVLSGGSATVTKSTVSGNTYGLRFVGDGSATLTNTTVSGNWFVGMRFDGGGGATLTNVTLSGNGDGLTFSGGGTATLTNTLLAKGANANCVFIFGSTAGAFTNGGHNLADDASCFANGALSSLVAATGLDPTGLQDNGGPTQTIALTATSPALDAGDDAVCAASGPGAVGGADQRGVSRTTNAGAHCDIGAYERAGGAPSPSPSPSPSPPAGAPRPQISGLVPAQAQAGGGPFALAVHGSGFTPASVVSWAGQPRPTTYVSAALLTAQIAAADIAAPAVTDLTVATPAPGGGTSPAVAFFITEGDVPLTGQASGSSDSAGGSAVASLGGSGVGTQGSLTATASGTGTVTVAQYGANPGGAPTFGTGAGGGTFLDAHISAGNTFTQVTLVACNLNGATTLYWWDGTAWLPASHQTQAPAGCITVTITAATSPSIAQLTGTYLAAGTPLATYTLALSATAGGTATAGAAGPYTAGTTATLTATAQAGYLFIGWYVDDQLASYRNPYPLAMNAAHSARAAFAPRPAFGDVADGDPAAIAIANLAARGVINGCDKDARPLPLFCPGDSTLRHQMAALIVRAMPGWQDETGLPSFSDNTADTELMTRVATVQRHGVAQGYQAEVCAAQGKAAPCYGPLDTVKYGQVLLFIARAMVAKGYWTLQADDRSIFPDQNGAVGADPETDQQTKDHRMVVTYVHYVQSVPDVADVHAPFLVAGIARGGWGIDSSRAWFARAFWPALQSYFGQSTLP